MKIVQFANGEQIPALGMGTWNIGDKQATRAQEIATLRLGISLGLRLIDTAEMYGEGNAEKLISEAIANIRNDVFLVSKVYPHNASRQGTIAACERSLRRLGTDHLDLYLLHWRGDIPLSETVDAFEQLKKDGKIRHFGVSNFDTDDMEDLLACPQGSNLVTNQVLYNLTRRSIELNLLPWCRQHGIPLMAYSPIEQAHLLSDAKLIAFAQKHNMTPAQAALGWLFDKDDVIVIPKTRHPERLRENIHAFENPLSPVQIAELDGLFPVPKKLRRLEML